MNPKPVQLVLKTVLAFLLLVVCDWQAQPCQAQGLTVQIPVVQFFDVGTVVSVPDGGTTLLGRVNRNSIGSVSRGVPGLSNVPGLNRLFTNRGIGIETSSSTATVTTRILIMSELEEKVMAEAARLDELDRGRSGGMHVPGEVQSRAELMTRSIRGGTKRYQNKR